MILGIDEAGRGPVIGPMVIGGVLVNDEDALKKLKVRDSKLVPPDKREELYGKIKDVAIETHFVSISAKEIDNYRKKGSLNELEAMKMAELIETFTKKPEWIFIDLPDPTAEGFINRIKKYTRLEAKVTAEHKADQNYPVVSAASIIAKVERDRAVRELEKRYNVELGTGYPHDERAIKYIEECAKRDERPPIIRYSWATAKRIYDRKKQASLAEF